MSKGAFESVSSTTSSTDIAVSPGRGPQEQLPTSPKDSGSFTSAATLNVTVKTPPKVAPKPAPKPKPAVKLLPRASVNEEVTKPAVEPPKVSVKAEAVKPAVEPPKTSVDTIDATLTTASPGSDLMEVEMCKGAVGLGFCIEGGKGSSLGDVPIKVKRLFKGEFGKTLDENDDYGYDNDDNDIALF